ncbi:hypothetical protein RUM43_010345 [Polyplax serrata]|uniref:Nudix hydrolase domain-containing protein n=1 Tax=Polyplax serrata TaxID=468196 RepID=A0AAN8P439_POLSC
MSTGKIIEKLPLHYKCRNSVYPKSNNIERFPVPDDKVSWLVSWAQYLPVVYNSLGIKDKPWADPPLETPNFKPKWNELDGDVNRKSHFTDYDVIDGAPLNPIGRTGIKGRGCLGRWGPNHAADSILTRWKRSPENVVEFDFTTQKPILQFVAIERKDCKEWAIPGGMVDPGETVSNTLKREFLEEALNILAANEKEKEERKKSVEEYFSTGLEIYKGYVDDPRNTDNAWMETVATNFHDEHGKYASKMDLSAGDDALNVKWVDINSNLVLYASHKNFIAQVAKIRKCHW